MWMAHIASLYLSENASYFSQVFVFKNYRKNATALAFCFISAFNKYVGTHIMFKKKKKKTLSGCFCRRYR